MSALAGLSAWHGTFGVLASFGTGTALGSAKMSTIELRAAESMTGLSRVFAVAKDFARMAA
jgi:hypothetical protein